MSLHKDMLGSIATNQSELTYIQKYHNIHEPETGQANPMQGYFMQKYFFSNFF